jgi:hypothetical protein
MLLKYQYDLAGALSNFIVSQNQQVSFRYPGYRASGTWIAGKQETSRNAGEECQRVCLIESRGFRYEARLW